LLLYIYGCEHPRTVCLVRKYTPTNTPKDVFADSSHPYHNQKQLGLMYEIWRICDTNNTNRTSGK